MEDMAVYNSNIAYNVCWYNVSQSSNAAYNVGTDNVQVNLTENHHNRVNIPTEASKSNVSANKTKFCVFLIVMLLLLIALVSIALSVAAYNQSKSTESILQNQLNDDIEAVLTQLATTRNNISQILSEHDTKINDLKSQQQQIINMESQLPNCGPGLWWQVAYLNMSDPTQQCPPVWREYNERGIRACGRPVSSNGSCAANLYSFSYQYTRVCGRVIGYQIGSVDAFSQAVNNKIDFDGVNITRGSQHGHVWSYVGGRSERSHFRRGSNCPCLITTDESDPPPFIGDNYYCESGNPNDTIESFTHIYSNDPLWDGQQCEGTCCNSTMSPPWFIVQLPAPTTDAIEVSICCNERTNNEDTPIKLLEIYVH